jgi:hypothetical protein
MNTTARTANADQLHATVRDARDCDAINPCASCQGMTTEVRAARHQARVAAHRATIVKAPSMSMFEARLTGSLNA